MSARTKDDGTGCIVLVALALICWGAVSIWGFGALFIVGLAIIAILALG